MSRLHYADFSGSESHRNVNIGRRQRSDKNDFLNKRQQERERRAQERKNEKSAVVIQAAWRSLVSRRRSVLDFQKDLSQILASASLGARHRKAISLFLLSSRSGPGEELVTALVNHLARQQEVTGFTFHKNEMCHFKCRTLCTKMKNLKRIPK